MNTYVGNEETLPNPHIGIIGALNPHIRNIGALNPNIRNIGALKPHIEKIGVCLGVLLYKRLLIA